MQKLKLNNCLNGILMLILTVALHSQVVILSPQNESVESLHHVAVIIVGKPGAEAKCYVNGELSQTGIVRIDGKYDFLNIEVPDGPVEIKVESRGARNKMVSAIRKFHILGPVSKLIPNKESLVLPADGKSTRPVEIEIQDAWGYKVDRVKVANIVVQGSSVVETDLDSAFSGHQLPIKNGELEFHIRAGKEVGYTDLKIEVNGVALEIPVQHTTPKEDFLVVGTAGAGLSLYHSETNAGFSRFTLSDFRTGEFEKGGLLGHAQAALYAKGTFKEKYRVTASYDSRRRRDNQLFRDLDPKEQYALYGDASTITYDAMTQSKFFGKIERNESFLIFGDFNTNMRGTEFAAYDRTFTGLISQYKHLNHQVTGFATLNDRKMELDEIRGEGISGYYFLSSSNITINSDKVRIEVRDRYHPETVLKSTEKTRFADYDINYVDGTLMFKQPVPSIDAGGNPVFVVVSYEYKTDKDKAVIGGLRYEGKIADKLQLGSTFIVEEQNPKNYMLYGADAQYPLASWMTLKGEYAASRSSGLLTENEDGKAYRAELSLKPLPSLELNGYYREVDRNFFNPSQTGSRFDRGGKKYGGDGTWKVGSNGTLKSEYYQQQNQAGTVNENSVEVLKAHYEHKLNEKLSTRVGYDKAERSKTGMDSLGTQSYNSNLIRGQIAYQWTDKIASTFEHEQNMGSSGKQALPTATSVGLTYALTEKVGLFLKARLLDSEKRRSQTIFGVDSRITENTQMTGKYEIGGAAGEQLSRATIGLNNKWNVRHDLTLNTAYESTATMDSLEVPTPDHQSLALSFEYLPEKPWKSSGKFEMRKDKTMQQSVFGLGTEYKILDGLAMIAKMEHMIATYQGKSDDIWSKGNYQIGMAYRPELKDWFNSIAKVQLLLDKNTHIRPRARLNRMIGSVHGYWQPKTWLEFGGRFAMRYLLDEEIDTFKNSTLTTLYSLRTEIGWNMKWSTGFDMRLVHLSPVNQTKFGLSVDVAYVLLKNMQVGVGYILKNLDDPDFSASEYQFNNFYLLFRMKFSEDIFDWR